jgi:hypothetical protein
MPMSKKTANSDFKNGRTTAVPTAEGLLYYHLFLRPLLYYHLFLRPLLYYHLFLRPAADPLAAGLGAWCQSS